MRLLWTLDHGLQSASKRMSTALGVTGPQRLVLRLVGRFPGISAGRLADALRLHPSTLTGVLRRLHERGYVERRSDPGDSRRALFWLTRTGEQVNQRRTGTVESAVRRVLGRSDAGEVAAAQALLSRLADAVEELGTPEPVPGAPEVRPRKVARAATRGPREA